MKPRYSFAEDLANEISASEELPIDLEKICDRLKIRLMREELTGLSGAAIADGDIKTIIVNKSEHEARQRFTISHELGHLLMHKNETVNYSQGPVVLFRESSNSAYHDWKEREANCFAANLLMPKEALAKKILELPDLVSEDVVQILSDEFRVSTQAMSIRLGQLGFASY